MRKRFETWFQAAAGTIHDRPWLFIIIATLVAAGLGMQVSRLRIDTSNESYFHHTDPVLTVYDDFKAQFGTDELVIVAIEAPNVFDPAFLHKLEDLHNELTENVPHLADITSLVNARNTRGEPDRLIVEDLLENFPQTDTELAALKERAMSNPLYINRLISPDATMTGIILETDLAETEAPDDVLAGFDDEPAGREEAGKQPARTKNDMAETIVNKVEEITARYDSDGFDIQLAGVPVVLKVQKEAMMKDMGRFMMFALLIISICLLIMFRRISGVLLPLMVVILSLFSTLGLMGLFNVPFTLPSMILPSFLLAVGVGAAVHILSLVFREMGHGEDKRTAIVHALGHSGIAVVITSFTTAMGLASFATTALAPIAALGIFGGSGVLLSLFYTIVLIPALLATIPLKMKKALPTAVRSNDRFDHLMDWITEMVARRPKIIATVTLLLMLAGLCSALQLHFSHNVLEWQPPSWECRQATEKIDRIMGGTINIEIVVDTGKENGLYDPAVLKDLDRLALELKIFDDGKVKVANASSVADIIKEIHQALNENRPDFYKVPGNAALIPQEFLLFENSGSDDLGKVIDSSFRKARFTLQVPWLDVFYYTGLLHEIKISFQETFENRAAVTTTGLMQLFVHTVKAAALSMAEGYITAAVLITIMMILLVGGLRMGLVSMIPNLAPVIFVMGLMYWLGLPLDTYTMMIGTIALGLAVDDTVHFLNSFRRYFSQGQTAKEAVRSTLRTSGRAMLITTVVLALGFFMFTFASMLNIERFGYLTGMSLVLALLADFFSVPALMVLMYSNSKKRRSKMKKITTNLTAITFSALLAAIVSFAVVSPCAAKDLTALEIMQKADARDDGDNMTCDRTMVLIDKNSHKRTRTMGSFSKDKGADTLKLIFFTAPADVRGTGFLTWDYRKGDRDDDQWLYLPELKKVKRIASADKSGAFMGSDFSYADMTKRVVEEWRYKLLKTDTVRGNPCWLIQAVPVNETVQDRYGYKESILFIRQDIFMMCRAVHWLDEGNKIKYLDIPDIQKIDGIWTAIELDAKTTRSGKTLHRTVFRSKNVKYGQAIEEAMFTTRQLEKGM